MAKTPKDVENGAVESCILWHRYWLYSPDKGKFIQRCVDWQKLENLIYRFSYVPRCYFEEMLDDCLN